MKTLELINTIEIEAKDKAEAADTQGYLDKMLNLVYASLIYEELTEAIRLSKPGQKFYKENDDVAECLIRTFCKKSIDIKLQSISKILVVNCNFQTIRHIVDNAPVPDSQRSFASIRDDSLLARQDFRNAYALLFNSKRKITT